MSVQGSFLPPGFAYWPMGDIYPLQPVWSELHTSQSILPVDESPITCNHIIPFGFDWSVDVELTDLGTVLDTTWWYPGDDAAAAADDTIPTGYVRTESVISKPWGWSNYYAFTATPIMSTDPTPVWTGKIRLGVDVELQKKLGFGEAWPFRVRIVLNDDVNDYPVYVMVGYLVVRP